MTRHPPQVDASFQFLADDFPPASWGPDPTGAAYRLGAAFARHFGPQRAPANVSLDSVEVGNEPWAGYNASFYNAVRRLPGGGCRYQPKLNRTQGWGLFPPFLHCQ